MSISDVATNGSSLRLKCTRPSLLPAVSGMRAGKRETLLFHVNFSWDPSRNILFRYANASDVGNCIC